MGTEGSDLIDWVVPPRHPCYADHFPHRPIVPGALLMQWLCREVELRHPGYRVGEIVSMKFLATLAPGERCRLECAEGPRPHQLRLHLLNGGDPVCKGVLTMIKSEP